MLKLHLAFLKLQRIVVKKPHQLGYPLGYRLLVIVKELLNQVLYIIAKP
jgi:hypothetical protein